MSPFKGGRTKCLIENIKSKLRAFSSEDKIDIFNIMKDKEMSAYTPDNQWKSLEDADEFLNLAFWLYDLNHHTFKHFFDYVCNLGKFCWNYWREICKIKKKFSRNYQILIC